MALGFLAGFLLGSVVTYFLVRGNKRRHRSQMDDISEGLHKIKALLKDVERDA